MRWHYIEGKKRIGLVTDEELAELFNQGKITADTFVWHGGMEEWITYGSSKSQGTPREALPEEPPVGIDEAGKASCVECGGKFPVADTIRYQEAHVCANCKPVFFQKLAEGVVARPAAALRLAPFLTRSGAFILDYVIFLSIGFVVALMFVMMDFLHGYRGLQIQAHEPTRILRIVVVFFLRGTYETFMVGAFGGTLGKLACGLRVVTAEGAPLNYFQAQNRFLAKTLSGLFCLIGYLMAINDPQVRTLHDRLCRTRVVIRQR